MFPMSNGTILDLRYARSHTCLRLQRRGMVFGTGVEDIEAASEELAEPVASFWGRSLASEMNCAYRHFKGPDGRVYGLNEQKKK